MKINRQYEFNATTGNLTFRKNILRNLTETFTYDNLNRLTAARINGAANYLNLTYESNGNILSKTDAATLFKYESAKPHAVTELLDPKNIPSINQNISYTSFNKVESITEGDKRLEFTYGIDNLRRKTVFEIDNVVQQTKYFVGSYEEEIDALGNSRKIHYLPGGAVYIAEDTTANMYYTYTDHLGSIIVITDSVGSIVEERDFDAWGRQRSIAYRSYEHLPTSSLLDRGYTGHQHLYEFGIINMNGRLYDPVLGRMLSPDPYVQLPGFAQNYNRYSYVVNNPLLYTDPSGHLFGIDDLIVGSVGFLWNYVSYGIRNDDWGWKAIGSGFVGAGMAVLGYNTGGLSKAVDGATKIVKVAAGLQYGANMLANNLLNTFVNYTFDTGDGFAFSVFPTINIGGDWLRAGLGFSTTFYSNHFSMSMGGSLNYNTQALGTNMKGWEGMISSQMSVYGKDWSAVMGVNNFFSGETSQSTGITGFNIGRFKFRYENDVPFSDGGDRFRSAAGYLGITDVPFVGEVGYGFNLFTGDVGGLSRKERDTPQKVNEALDGQMWYNEKKVYRAGLAYARIGNHTFGGNSEDIRHTLQNRIAHRQAVPWFRRYDNIYPAHSYYMYRTFNQFTLY